MQVQDVDLRLLRIFVTIVECGGLSAAESRLNIGRSTISAHLSDLEIRLGVTLCKRGRSGFELTEPGRITYQASLELLQQCEAFASTVAGSKHKLSGRVSLAVIDTLVSDPRCGIAQAIAALKQKSDSIQFDLYVCEAREVETAVANGRSLLGIGVSRHPIRGLDYIPLFNETNYLYCGSDHPLFACDAQAASKLLPQAEVITSNYMRDKERRNDGLNYQNSAIAYHDEGIAHLILSGKFIGYLPEHYASHWVEKGLFKAIMPQKYCYQIPVMLITSNNHASSPLAQAMIDAIKRSHSVRQ
ncbi:MAG: LysR family transcriptional regulator [Gammaproteobacteria bacterium]|nr:LysR family transcriptional regulator [Gammaproteobacteria bacterium]MBU1556488.1 LysR family transcriptional regulator [Gammaproteobacteria bacterium]MBU2070451.1 LysR family transcriptional regulator [Gammaproteobacteria bacterium]MBU2185252.1 LysR family transcriptional regulator [Gammaproteobacteria bacterium]MBU2205043.1 LysR family transcriptional regulator [Gammaproteobacteria bacterium]